MAELLLELFSEEVPARMQASATDHLVRELTNGLKEAGVDVGVVTSFATPRRIGLCVADLPVQTEATSEERRGPRADKLLNDQR